MTPKVKNEELLKSKFHTYDQINEGVHIKPRQPVKQHQILDYDTTKNIVREDPVDDDLQEFLRDYNEDTQLIIHGSARKRAAPYAFTDGQKNEADVQRPPQKRQGGNILEMTPTAFYETNRYGKNGGSALVLADLSLNQ